MVLFDLDSTLLDTYGKQEGEAFNWRERPRFEGIDTESTRKFLFIQKTIARRSMKAHLPSCFYIRE